MRRPWASEPTPRNGRLWLSLLGVIALAVLTWGINRGGIVFENRERLLPDEPIGYYHEYTVPTPGSSDRGARRIITGSGAELYWTDDHYRSFERITR